MTKSPINSPMNIAVKIKTLIIHHVPLVRSGLVALIETTGRFAVCGETDDAPTGREMFLKHQPHVVALGLTLCRGDGIDLIKDFRRINDAARLLAVSVHEDLLTIQRMTGSGVRSLTSSSRRLRSQTRSKRVLTYFVKGGRKDSRALRLSVCRNFFCFSVCCPACFGDALTWFCFVLTFRFGARLASGIGVR